MYKQGESEHDYRGRREGDLPESRDFYVDLVVAL
jgi:hypothetical protein